VNICAAVTDAKEAPFEIQALELSDLRQDEVLVKVAAAGIAVDDIERAARDSEAGEVVKPVLRMA
jgi:D-arabinose 1-dehydrogenase-like Zn-dependent alcohol dehydrogenase